MLHVFRQKLHQNVDNKNPDPLAVTVMSPLLGQLSLPVNDSGGTTIKFIRGVQPVFFLHHEKWDSFRNQ